MEGAIGSTKTGQNFRHWRGDYQPIIVTIKDANGDPIDLTGLLAAVWEASDYEALDTALLTKKLNDGIEIHGAAANGQLLITISFGDTGEFNIKHHYHELHCKYQDGVQETAMSGDMHLIGTHVA